MKLGSRFVWVILVLAGLAWHLRPERSTSPPPSPFLAPLKSEVPDPAPARPAPQTLETPPVLQPAPEAGRLVVTLEFEGPSPSGTLVVLGPEGMREDSQIVNGASSREFAFDPRTPGIRTVLFVPVRHARPASGTVELSGNGEAGLTLRLEAAAKLEGIVLDALRRPLPGASISATIDAAFPPLAGPDPDFPHFGGGRYASGRSHSYSISPRGSLTLSTRTLEDGRFVLDGLSPDALNVVVSHEKTRLETAAVPGTPATFLLPVVPTPAKQ